MFYRAAGLALFSITLSCPAAAAESPREILMGAAFSVQEKAMALSRIDLAIKRPKPP